MGMPVLRENPWPAPAGDPSASRALLDAIIESLPFRVWACDREGRCILQNSQSVQDFGPFVGQPTQLLPLPPEQMARWHASFDRALAGQVDWTEATVSVGGELRTYRHVVAPIQEGDIIGGVVGVDLDITDLRRAEAALATSEERLRCVTENAPDIILQINRDSTITYINRVRAGHDAKAVLGSKVADWVPPAYRPVIQAAIDRCFDHGEFSHYETEGLGGHGQLAWYSSRISPVMNDEQVASAIIIATDMTEAQQAEAALRDSEERFRQLASSIDEGFWLIGLDPERLLYINPAFERIWGSPAATFYSTVRSGEEWVHPEDRTMVCQKLDDWLAGRGDFDLEYRIIRPDGQVRWVRDRGAKILDTAGRFYRASGIVRDITAQKAAEQALRESETLYRLLADHSSDLISRHTPDGQWVYLSPACRTLLGYAPEELVDQDPFNFIHPEDIVRATRALAEMASTGQAQAVTMRVRHADKRYLWFETQGRAVFDSAGKLTEIVCTSRDVTQRIEATRQLRQRESELAHAERLSTMGQIAAELAHELNQPLYAIANFADACLGRVEQLAAAEPKESPPRVELVRWIGQIGQQARRAGAVVRRLTQFVRKGELDRETLDPNQLVNEVALLLEFGVRNRGIDVHFELAAGLPNVEVDRLLIEQVLVNLVRNGADAMEDVAPERKRIVVRSFLAGEGWVGISVTDAGRGLPMGQIDRLFEPYFTTKPDGTGMGLAICRSTIEAHGGRIWAENNPTGGATFQFTLPVAVERPQH